MNGLLKWLTLGTFLYMFYRNRYRLLNVLLGNFYIRKAVVGASMKIPGIRSLFLQSSFRS
ncbi:hypothetical protein [Rossellomorea sp. BNER]|uniref:hypothetical protein n=1 Tax=Rossellomorea sp. BNER TaxID=2962031 RepID=UPI003AF2DE1F|nr:hypothetical protein [Rossellomorea sp. BNER]